MADVSMNGISFTIVGDTRNAIRAIKNLKSSLRDLNSDLQTVGDRTERTSTRLKSALKVLSKAGGAVVKPFKSGVTAVLTRATSRVNAFAKGVKKLTGGIGRIAMYRAFRSIIRMITDAFREGTKNLYAWSSAFGGTFAKNMDDAATSMLYFKNSVGAAWSPLMNILAPALRTVTDAAVELLNVINQLLARLTGQSSWTRAIRKATEYGDAVGGAGAAAKEAMRYLAPFDELNVLPSDKGSGGGGGSATDTSGMFEEVLSFDTGIADFADKVKEAINSENWTGLGVLLGNKVNEIVDYLEENKVFENAGKKIGKEINAWFTTKYWTLQTINFTNIGSNIATALNNAIGEIDFNIIGRSITQGFTNTIDFLIGFLGELDWVSVGNSVRDLLVGAFNQITQWAQKINWSNVGTQLYNGLKDAIEGLDLSSIATSFFTMLGTALGAASEMIKSIASNIWTAIKSYFLGFIKDENGNGELDGGEILEGLLKGIDNAIKNIASWVKDHIWTPFVNGFKSTFGIKSPAETMVEPGQMIGEGILEGILQPFKDIGAWIKEHILDPIKEKFKGFSLKKLIFGEDGELGSGSGDSETFNIDVKATLTKVGQWTEDVVEVVKEKGGEVKKVVKASAEKAGQWASEVAEAIGIKDGDFVTKTVKTAVEKAGKWASDVAEAIGIKDGDSVTKTVQSVVKKGSTWIADAWTAAKTEAGAITRTVTSVTKKGSWVSDAFTAAKMGAKSVTRTVSSIVKKGSTFTTAAYKVANMGASKVSREVDSSVYKSLFFDEEAYEAAKMKKGSVTREIKAKASASYTPNALAILTAKDGTVNVNASLQNPYWKNGTPTMEVNASVKANGGRAKGGSYYGGAWHDIAQYAEGNTNVKHGTIFAAGEAGAEVVGHIGGRTEVLNQSQLASVMYASVSKAMHGLRFEIPTISTSSYDAEMDEDAMYRAMLRALNDSDAFPDEIDLDGDVVYRKMVSRNRLNTRMTGVNAMASVIA